VDSQSGRGRFVIEPPEVGAVLAGMTMAAGVAEARRASPAASGARDQEEEGVAGDETASGNIQPARGEGDSVTLHASDGSLSPAPVARRGRPRAMSTSSSGSSSSHDEGKRDHQVASVVIQMSDMQAAVASMEPSSGKDAGAGDGRQADAVVASSRREPSESSEDGEQHGDRRLVTEEAGGQRATGKQKRKRGSCGLVRKGKKKAARQSVVLHESEGRVRENRARSPHYTSYVPMYSPPPPLPGYASQGGYVPAAAAGSSSDRARDAQYGARGGSQRDPQRGYEGERARSRGRSTTRHATDDRARSPAGSRARSRGRSVAGQHDARERTPPNYRARSRGRSVGRRREEHVRTSGEARGRSRGRSASLRPDGDRARSRGRSVGAREVARRQDTCEQRRRRNRSRSRSQR
jgi:hypothetical protein